MFVCFCVRVCVRACVHVHMQVLKQYELQFERVNKLNACEIVFSQTDMHGFIEAPFMNSPFSQRLPTVPSTQRHWPVTLSQGEPVQSQALEQPSPCFPSGQSAAQREEIRCLHNAHHRDVRLDPYRLYKYIM